MTKTLLVIAVLLYVGPSRAETVPLKYRSPVNLATFVCNDVTRSSFIHRVCYDEKERYMILRLKETYYDYCEIDKKVVSDFQSAPIMGVFYNDHIRGHGKEGPFNCQTHHRPAYAP